MPAQRQRFWDESLQPNLSLPPAANALLTRAGGPPTMAGYQVGYPGCQNCIVEAVMECI